GVFFDGTGNNLANAVVTEQCRHDDLQLVGERTLQEVMDYCQRHGFSDSNGDGYFTQAPDGSYGNAPSNVARLYGLYRDDTDQPLAADAESAVVRIYLEGIGTSSGEADSLYGQITGRGDTGIQARVRQS
ncbi:MAG TPA: type IV secretion protein Rhs, partial [Pseudomonas sp.]|nr:type IV secretion protein Rhs [Pseudomonas sp.]